jgi:hypothetical protein
MEVDGADECAVCMTRMRRPIACPYCPSVACFTCTKRYVLDTATEPHCMGCRKAWTAETLDTLFTRAFRRGELRKHGARLLMERERSLLVATQAVMAREEEEAARVAAWIKSHHELTRETERWREQWTDLGYGLFRGPTMAFVQAATALMEAGMKLRQARDALPESPHTTAPTAAPAEERRVVVRPCPTPECRGHLNGVWHCTLCKQYCCPQCREGVGAKPRHLTPSHTCSEETLATVRELQRLCKPCPKCGVEIERSMGCAQMFCTACYTAFDWNTLRIVTGPIHNPHFFEFQRGQGGAMGGECGAAFGVANMSAAFQAELLRSPNDAPARAWALATELRYGQRAVPTYTPDTFTALRRRFLAREIDEKRWLALLSAGQTRMAVARALHDARETYIHGAMALLRDGYNGAAVDKGRVTERLVELVTFVNELLGKVATEYGHKLVYRIDNWQWTGAAVDVS